MHLTSSMDYEDPSSSTDVLDGSGSGSGLVPLQKPSQDRSMEKKPMEVLCTEQYGSSLIRDYTKTPEGRIRCKSRGPRFTSVAQVFRSVFLPQGYPDSVSGDYAAYQVWDTVQAFASSVSGALATHSLLQGMGVGDESASVLAATLTWILKDGTGMTGRIVFAWLKGNRLDCEAKRWRLFADVLNDFALCLEVAAAPLAGEWFRGVVIVAGVCKALVGVAGGATRAALTQHQARSHNLGDVAAKDGSQETLVNLAALLVSLALLPLVAGETTLVAALFLLMTFVHLYANYRAVRAVCMESLNQARLHIIMDAYLRHGNVPSVETANASEPLFWGTGRPLPLHLGASVRDLTTDLDDLRQTYAGLGSRYLLQLDRGGGRLVALLSPGAGPKDQLQACVQAEVVCFLLAGGQLSDGDGRRWEGGERALLTQSWEATRSMLPALTKALTAAGWNPDLCLLAADEWRVDWETGGRKDV